MGSEMCIRDSFSPDKGQFIFHLQELSLVQSFYDFLKSLPDSLLVYSDDESKQLLHNIYDKYKALPEFTAR